MYNNLHSNSPRAEQHTFILPKLTTRWAKYNLGSSLLGLLAVPRTRKRSTRARSLLAWRWPHGLSLPHRLRALADDDFSNFGMLSSSPFQRRMCLRDFGYQGRP
jgi:hypothetical protein